MRHFDSRISISTIVLRNKLSNKIVILNPTVHYLDIILTLYLNILIT